MHLYISYIYIYYVSNDVMKNLNYCRIFKCTFLFCHLICLCTTRLCKGVTLCKFS